MFILLFYLFAIFDVFWFRAITSSVITGIKFAVKQQLMLEFKGLWWHDSYDVKEVSSKSRVPSVILVKSSLFVIKALGCYDVVKGSE